MKLKAILVSTLLSLTCSVASAGIPIGNNSLTSSEKKESAVLCKQAMATEGAGIRRDAEGKDAETVRAADGMAAVYDLMCIVNGQPPAYWHCVIDRQGRNEQYSSAAQQCNKNP